MEDEILEENVQSEGVSSEGSTDTEREDAADTQNGDGFSDEGGSEQKATASKTEKNPDGRNAKNAERRRTMEAAEAKAVREQAILDALGHKNPYTDEEMKDSEDVEEYLMMREIEKGGGDPVADLSKYQKQRARERRVAMENEVQEKEKLGKEVEDFKAEYPEVDLAALFEDKNFAVFAKGKLGAEGASLTDVYREYEDFVESLTGEKAKQAKEAQALANRRAGVGSLASSHKEEPGYYTPEQVRAMSREEIKANYENIVKSEKKW